MRGEAPEHVANVEADGRQCEAKRGEAPERITSIEAEPPSVLLTSGE
jgi:hypothetical protein